MVNFPDIYSKTFNPNHKIEDENKRVLSFRDIYHAALIRNPKDYDVSSAVAMYPEYRKGLGRELYGKRSMREMKKFLEDKTPYSARYRNTAFPILKQQGFTKKALTDIVKTMNRVRSQHHPTIRFVKPEILTQENAQARMLSETSLQDKNFELIDNIPYVRYAVPTYTTYIDLPDYFGDTASLPPDLDLTSAVIISLVLAAHEGGHIDELFSPTLFFNINKEGQSRSYNSLWIPRSELISSTAGVLFSEELVFDGIAKYNDPVLAKEAAWQEAIFRHTMA